MPFIDSLLWVAMLVGGLALSLWYGASWWGLATALAEAGQRPTAAPLADRLQAPTAQTERSEALV